MDGPTSLGGLLLQLAQRPELTLGRDDLLDGRDAEGADQLVLEVGHADVEAERRHPGAVEVDAEAGALEAAREVALLARVAEARQPDLAPVGSELTEMAADVLRSAHGDDRHTLGVEPQSRGGRRASRPRPCR